MRETQLGWGGGWGERSLDRVGGAGVRGAWMGGGMG